MVGTPFEFATATRIVFGEGVARNLPAEVRALGSHALLLTGRDSERTAWLRKEIECVVFPIGGEPTVDVARTGATLAQRERCDVVIAVGGGSVIDGGKAIAALAANSGEPNDYLEVVGRGNRIERPSLPFIAVPTTAGTGAEVTRNAVLQSPEHRVKASLRSPSMLPRLAVVDPELTYNLPPEVTASTGLDALTQLIEPYVSVRANPLTDVLALEGMRRVARALRSVWSDPGNRAARRDMALASLYGGLALANAGLGVVHGFAAPIGGMWTAPHGAVCAALLPHGMAANIAALRSRGAGEAIVRYDTVARVLTGNEAAVAGDGVEWVLRLCSDLRIPPLHAYGLTVDDLPDVAAKAGMASSMKANPVVLLEEELLDVLRAAL